MPRSSDAYPFTGILEDGKFYTDIELYKKASAHLRVLIQKGKRGVIYGVSSVRSEKNPNIVKALNFKTKRTVSNCFPLIFLKAAPEDIPYNQSIQNEYLFSSKEEKTEHLNKNTAHLLDHYYLLFRDGVVGKYLDYSLLLKRNTRFGFSNNENPDLALVDYVFETALNCIKNKFEKSNLKWDIYLNIIKEKLSGANIFAFAIFSFLFKINTDELLDTDIINNIQQFYDLSIEIANALNQIIQNSLLHSTEKICAISFIKTSSKNENDIPKDSLNIMVSDLSKQTIKDSFLKTLKSEIGAMNEVFENDELSHNLIQVKDKILKANNRLILNSDHIEIKNLFNDFNKTNHDLIKSWYLFRQADSSAHIGLTLFSNIMKKCGGKFIVYSHNNYSFTQQNYYCNYNNCEKVDISNVIPGTQFNIILPIQALEKYNSFNMAQLNYKSNYYDNYKTYSKFIDSSLNTIFVNEIFADKCNKIIKTLCTAKNVSQLDKFSLQVVWTHFWMSVFNEKISKNKPNIINHIDFDKIPFRSEYIKSEKNREVILKGMINALGVFCEQRHSNNIYLAITNLSRDFITCFKEITLSLSIKSFPKNLQLFISDKTDTTQLHMFGNNYGEAIQNAYVLSIENGIYSYNSKIYYTITELFKPFENILVRTFTDNEYYLVPFTSFLSSVNNSQLKNMFFDNITKKAEDSIIDECGYKFKKSHIRLGNKVHTNQFYEMSFLFYRTVMANRVAFEIIDTIKKNGIDILNDTILFYGYASYSQAILMSITSILKMYRESHQSNAELTYAVYQYNLQSETSENDIQIYYKDYKKFKSFDNIKVIQIVPISSTLTTFGKMWEKFNRKYNRTNNNRHILSHNHTVIWVRDDIKSKQLDKKLLAENSANLTNIENKYYTEPIDQFVVTKFPELKECDKVHFILNGHSYWELPENCKMCYPDDLINEIPIIETDPTSTVPSQQINSPSIHLSSKMQTTDENNKRIAALNGLVYYGHVKRGKNHYQYYINTQDYFAKVCVDVKSWLETCRANDLSELNNCNMPCLHIIFSPEHNTNVGFSQYVNAFYFNGTAEIISINEDKEFRSNFVCEHAALKNTILKLFDNFYEKTNLEKKGNFCKPVKFYFADDDIISGDTIHKASNLLQSLLPQKYLKEYTTSVFDKCFFLIDRLSESTKASYILPKENFYSFCHINVSNMRKQGDSCIGCKLLTDAERLLERSATRFAANYWSLKVIGYSPKSFEELAINNYCKKEHYYRFAFSHIIKTIFSTNSTCDENTYFQIIVNIFSYYSGVKTKNRCYYDSMLEKLSSSIFEENIDRKTLIKCLIKVITRPFITYNHTIKHQVLKFMILLSESIIDKNYEKKYKDISKQTMNVIKNIKNIFDNEPRNYILFLRDYIFEAFLDLHSTYLMRKETIYKTLLFINSFDMSYLCSSPIGDIDKEICNNSLNFIQIFWLYYAVYIQKTIDGSSDESRSLRFEHLLLTGVEEYCSPEDLDDKNAFGLLSKSILLNANDKIENPVKQGFELFCKEIFITNGHLLIDGLSQISRKTEDNNMKISDEYFMSRWKNFRKFDSLCLSLSPLNDYYNSEIDLYKHLMEQNAIIDSNRATEEKLGRDLIIERYELLLKKAKEMIVQKYDITDTEVNLAILTKYNTSGEHLISFKDLEIITCMIPDGNSQKNSNTKYGIKKTIIDVLSDKENRIILQNMGYYVSNQTNSNANIVFMFDTSSKMLDANHEMREIVPVYLYIGIKTLSKEKNEILPWFVLRDILSYRNSIMHYLVEDFTSDVVQRYAHSIGTEAILKHEKVISHSPMKDDKQILSLLSNYKKNLEFFGVKETTLFKWVIARNYCNAVIARLYNRVFRNINRSLSEIIVDSNRVINREVAKLYVKSDCYDGNSTPINKIIEVLPPLSQEYKNDDPIYTLFREIIDFKFNNKPILEKAKALTKTVSGEEYTYNIDYIKNIIYRICFDALRFSHGAGAETNDFISRIINHYEYQKKREMYDDCEEESLKKVLLKRYKDNCACEIIFDIETSDHKDFDWLVIKNKLSVLERSTQDGIKNKIEDPLDFTDGHMSLITEKEFVAKLLNKDEEDYLNRMMFTFNDEYFITRLPIIKKEEKNVE